MKRMTYQETLDWIHSTLKFGIKPGIARMEWMLHELGNPQKNLKGIHVVGTNGKGSTTNYLQHIFTEAGYEVGTFTSPYIMDFCERIAINGRMISQEDLVLLAEKVKPVVDRLPVETTLEPATEFEIITTMMFYYFGVMHPVEVAVIEAGLGGLHDSTNVFNPLAVICPSIGLDHQNILGQTYAEIAAQKAGVLYPDVPFIFAEDKEEVLQVFYSTAKMLSCPTFRLGHDFTVSGKSSAFEFVYDNETISGLSLAMSGQHQVANASLSIMTSLLIAPAFPKVTQEIIKKALSKARWLGRTEMMADNLMIDGAHNDESVKVLVNLLKEEYSERKIHILFAAIDTKPIDSMLEQLSVFESLTVTTFDYPNSVKLEHYPEAYNRVPNALQWLTKIEEATEENLFVVTGSLYFISQVRSYLLQGESSEQ